MSMNWWARIFSYAGLIGFGGVLMQLSNSSIWTCVLTTIICFVVAGILDIMASRV